MWGGGGAFGVQGFKVCEGFLVPTDVIVINRKKNSGKGSPGERFCRRRGTPADSNHNDAGNKPDYGDHSRATLVSGLITE